MLVRAESRTNYRMGENKPFKYLESIKFNVYITIALTIIALVIGQLPDLPDSIGFGGFIPLFTPVIIGFLTLIFYFISRSFLKKWNWIIIVIGGTYNLYEAFDWYLHYKNYK